MLSIRKATGQQLDRCVAKALGIAVETYPSIPVLILGKTGNATYEPRNNMLNFRNVMQHCYKVEYHPAQQCWEACALKPQAVDSDPGTLVIALGSTFDEAVLRVVAIARLGEETEL